MCFRGVRKKKVNYVICIHCSVIKHSWLQSLLRFLSIQQCLFSHMRLWVCVGPSSCLRKSLQRSVCQLLLISAGEVASVLSSDKAVTPRLKNVNPGAVTIKTFPRDRQCRTPQHNALMISHAFCVPLNTPFSSAHDHVHGEVELKQQRTVSNFLLNQLKSAMSLFADWI